MHIIPTFLIMLDISGYTRFMKFHATSLLHAEEIVTDLLETVLDKVDHPLQVAKLEGDAVFLYGEVPPEKQASAGLQVTRQISLMFDAFYQRERALLGCRHGCVCEACQNIGELRLKAVLHVGEAAVKQIRQFTELAGQDVILIHRLLKNSIPSREYVLMTKPFFSTAGGYQELLPEHRTEQVDDFGELEIMVFYPSYEKVSTEPTAAEPAQASGTAFAARLNQHSFARMLGMKPRAEFRHIPPPRLNLPAYLIEGIASGLNVLRQRLRPQRH